MSIFFLASADFRSLDVWDTYGANTSISSTYKRSGSYSFYCGNGAYLGKCFSARNEIWGQIAFYNHNSWSSYIRVLSLANEALTNLGGIYWSTGTGASYLGQTGRLFYYHSGDGSAITQKGTYKYFGENSVWVVLEFYIKFAEAVDGGRVKLWVNGILDIDYSGDTKPGADTNFTRIHFGSGSVSTYCYIDDVILADAERRFFGAYVDVLSPTGIGNNSGFTPSAGDNYACVDELPATQTEYVSTNTPDVKDTYAINNLPATAEEVLAVQAMYGATQKQGGSLVQNIQPVYRINGVDRLGTSTPLKNLSAINQQIQELSPDSGVAWTASEVNNMEFGLKAIS